MGTWLEKLVPFEKKILEELRIRNELELDHMVIAIGGLSGTGKDTLAANLKSFIEERFDCKLEIMSAGRFIRDFAEGKGYQQVDMDHFVTSIQDSKEFKENIDLMVDQSILKTALEKGGIFVGRMAPFAIGNWGLSIYLKCSPAIVARRLITDPKRAESGQNYQKVKHKIITRDEADRKRLGEFYDTDFDQLLKKVNLIIDTGTFSIEGVTNIAKSAVIDYFKKKVRKRAF